MSCTFEQEVSALFDGELAASEAAAVREHVSGCGSCRAMLGDLESMRTSIRELRAVGAGESARPFWRRRVSIPAPLAAALVLWMLAAPFIAFRSAYRAHPPSTASMAVRESRPDIFAPYDGGGRAVIGFERHDQA